MAKTPPRPGPSNYKENHQPYSGSDWTAMNYADKYKSGGEWMGLGGPDDPRQPKSYTPPVGDDGYGRKVDVSGDTTPVHLHESGGPVNDNFEALRRLLLTLQKD